MKNGLSSDDSPSFLSRLKRLCFKRFSRHDSDSTLRETIEELIEDGDETIPSIESDERELLGNVLNLRDLTVCDVMIPRTDIIAAPATVSLQELVNQFVQTGVTRIIVYQKTLDHVIGMVHIKDLLARMQSKKVFKLQSLLREVLFISPSMRTLDLLLQMRETGSKLAIVVDEYGGVDGLVTFSNLIEEIIGDIQDAHDHTPSSQIEVKSDGTVLADARTKLDELEETLSVKLKLSSMEEEIDTVGGLVYAIVGRIPVKGELIRHTSGIEFEVLDADLRRLKLLKIHHLI